MSESVTISEDTGNNQAPSKLKLALGLQFGNGLILLILGILGIHYFSTGYGRGSPYFIGEFVTGMLMLFLSALNLIDCNSSNRQKICTARFGIVSTLLVCLLALVGTIMVCTQGIRVYQCDMIDYNVPGVCVLKKLTENRIVAIFMLIFLIPSVIINGFCAALLVIYLKTFTSSHVYKPPDIEASPREEGTIIHGDTVIHPGISSSGEPYNPYSQSQSLAINTQSATSAPYGGTSNTIGYVPGVNDPLVPPQPMDAVSQLQEQNRLLREQLALQQQMLQLQQQQQQLQQATLTPRPSEPSPPPSYESCLADPTQLHNLEEQNMYLQGMYQQQEQQLPETKRMP